MNKNLKVISEDKENSALIKSVAEQNHYAFSTDSILTDEDNNNFFVIIADRGASNYNSVAEKLNVNHSLIILAERNDPDLSTDIKRLKPSGVIYKPADADYVYAAVETAFHSLSQKKEIEVSLEKARILAEEASEAKTRFIANISHEIRTPMNAIIGMTDMALLTNESEEILDYLIDLKSATGKLLDFTDNILNFSKIENGKMQLETGLFSLDALMHSAVNRYVDNAAEKGIIIKSSMAGMTNDCFFGDSLRIGQVLDHLISNSIKFTETGCIHLGVSFSGETFIHREKRHLLQFSVIDTGIGIPEEKINVIFENFRQAEDSRTKRRGGAGLGLSIAKKLVELMNGTIEVESTVGHGSRFYFTLPLKVEPGAFDVENKCSSSDSVMTKTLRILVVDDNPVNLRLAEIVLKKLGHVVESAKNGQIALDILRERNFDVLFMDIEMPVMDGLETTQHIRAGAAGADKQNVPIVAMTAYAVAEYEQECFKTGMNYFLTKPINVILIPELLNRIYEESSLS